MTKKSAEALDFMVKAAKATAPWVPRVIVRSLKSSLCVAVQKGNARVFAAWLRRQDKLED